MNHGDSKLQSIEASLLSHDGSITMRKLRAQRCNLQAKGIEATSSLEAHNLKVKAGDLGFKVSKRIGLDKDAHI
jgi:hypothetical protein